MDPVPSMEAVTIRPAGLDDAPAIAAIHVAAWLETYAGLLPAAMIAALTVEMRLAAWTRILGDPASGTTVAVAEGPAGLVGFGSCGAQRSAELAADGFDGEVSAIYVLRAAQRRGTGSALMAALAAHLRQSGHRAASLWVLHDNVSARQFYERLGGSVVGERAERREQATLMEVAYGWRDLAALQRSPVSG
ncbi:GNAT family N-acetyltransferase [Methylobacterium pseudosasicola]|uniref:L-amino acid N-acyltransferase YncA n=1 Tax=Methylobacterium pseudosasicola TaxID=582667 RepID=A0A1I4H6K6_9HYPH|nr:GNAT family N-acetyltransferase [Methylobacterium pseudosasicola]SFL37247.1 L-amino acid N-acyltransferase YncA [Methylobacterium pseudosasicola]